MATKKDSRSLMRKQLGRKTADALLNKLDKMAKQGVPSSTIERTLEEDLAASIGNDIKASIVPSASRGIRMGVAGGSGIGQKSRP